MRVGLAYNVKPSDIPAGLPEDAFEEYDSEATIGHIARALSELGHAVVMLPAGPGIVEALRGDRPDIVFNIAEGEGGRCREAHVPALLELFGIPYVGSDPLTLCVTLDKPTAKRLLRAEGFATPPFRTFRSAGEADIGDLPLPVIVKPAWEGSSKGVRLGSRASTPDAVREMVAFVTETYGQEAIVEAFVPGPEVTVGVVGNDPPRIVGVMEIAPRTVPAAEFVYSLEVKRDWKRLVEYRCPPPFPAAVLREIERAALGIYRLLGCQDFARLDFRIDAERVPQFIECNPLPGLSPGYGDLPIMADRMGLPYRELIREILGHALSRQGMAAS